MNDRTQEFDFQEIADRSARHATIGTIHLVVGETPGKFVMLDRPQLSLGRGESCDLRFAVEGVSRVHALIERSDDNLYTITDQQSTNGLFVNGFMTPRQILREGDRVALGPNLVFCFRLLQVDEASALEALSASQARDPQTGALTAAYFEEMVRVQIDLGQRRNFDLAVLCVQPQADQSLPALAAYLESVQKPGSVTGRVGANRFAQTHSYTSRSEVEKTIDQLARGLREQFGAGKVALGVAYSRELAAPTPRKLLDRASNLNTLS